MPNNDYPRLCGGTFFTLLLEAVAQRKLARELCLLCAPENNELGEVHWAIKKLDLMRLIQEQRLLMGA